MPELKLPVPVPALPTTVKEFIRAMLYLFGLLCLELFTGLGSVLLGVELKIPIDHWRALVLFLVFLVAFALVDRWQRDGHLQEQVRVAEQVAANGSAPPPSPA